MTDKIDIRRRFFVFGAAATLVLPVTRTFYLPPKRMLTLAEFWSDKRYPLSQHDLNVWKDLMKIAGRANLIDDSVSQMDAFGAPLPHDQNVTGAHTAIVHRWGAP